MSTSGRRRSTQETFWNTRQRNLLPGCFIIVASAGLIFYIYASHREEVERRERDRKTDDRRRKNTALFESFVTEGQRALLDRRTQWSTGNIDKISRAFGINPPKHPKMLSRRLTMHDLETAL